MGNNKAAVATTNIDECYKSIYITIEPDKYDAGLERAKRAYRRTKSVDDLGLVDFDTDDDFMVPWYNVVDADVSMAIIDKLHKSAVQTQKANAESKNNKNGKKVDTHAQLKIDFFKLLNVRDPSNGCSGFNVSKVNKMMDSMPSLASEKYLFNAFSEPVTALHMLISIDAPLSCVKRCFAHNRAAIYDASSLLGSPLHYACYYNTNIKIIRHICSKEIDNIDAVLCKTNRSKRTPLHLACMNHSGDSEECAASTELVQLLTSACPNAALLADKDGMTPLHHAISNLKPQLAIVEDLTEVNPKAGLHQTNEKQATPIHLAFDNVAITTPIIHDLIVSCPSVVQVQDSDGNTPVHKAVMKQRPISEIKLMIKMCPKALNIKNNKGKIPYKVAKSISKRNLDDDNQHTYEIVQILKSISVV
jgi:ankyrin repeat protein